MSGSFCELAWVKQAMSTNPSYTGYRPGDDYMSPVNAAKYGWESGLEYATWAEASSWFLDDLNHVVHFYFFADPGEERLELIFWAIHPRKGASRGVVVSSIQEGDLFDVYAFLARAFFNVSKTFDGLKKVV